MECNLNLNVLQAGRYENPEEHPFFPDNLPPSLVPRHKYPKVIYSPKLVHVLLFSIFLKLETIQLCFELIPRTQVLHPVFVNINKSIWDIYFNKLLPLFVSPGDDGNYASTAARDLDCLQVRISCKVFLSV